MKNTWRAAVTAMLMWSGIAGAQEVVYSVNFDNGLPEKWKSGVLTAENLPEGSKQAVTAPVTGGKPGSITSDQMWVRGHFTVADDLYFNYRIRMTSPGWYQIFLSVKDSGTAGTTRRYEAKPTTRGIIPGQWTVVSVPITEFKGTKGEHSGQPPQAGQVCETYFFATQGNDRGISIDRIWVTKGAPGTTPPAQ